MPSVPAETATKKPEKIMTAEQPGKNPRLKLMRELAVLQVKLLADGMRDAVLIPVSLVAGIVGLLRGGEEPEREFRRVIKLGVRSERWINLFGHQRPLGKSHPARSLDNVLEQAEAVVVQQLKKGRATDEDPQTEKKQERKES
jgi:hypothetical protein